MKKNDLAVMHWGTYHVTTDGDTLTSVRPVAWDRNPSAIGQSLPGAVQSETGSEIRLSGWVICRTEAPHAADAAKSRLSR